MADEKELPAHKARPGAALHPPPSEQSAQGPVPKPGEPIWERDTTRPDEPDKPPATEPDTPPPEVITRTGAKAPLRRL
jgi:hypothetical protein